MFLMNALVPPGCSSGSSGLDRIQPSCRITASWINRATYRTAAKLKDGSDLSRESTTDPKMPLRNIFGILEPNDPVLSRFLNLDATVHGRSCSGLTRPDSVDDIFCFTHYNAMDPRCSVESGSNSRFSMGCLSLAVQSGITRESYAMLIVPSMRCVARFLRSVHYQTMM